MIYFYFFSDHPNPTFYLTGHGMPKHNRYTQEEVNFRMTCRQILHETQDALCQHNTIDFHFSYWNSSLEFPKNFASNAVRSLKLVHDFKLFKTKSWKPCT